MAKGKETLISFHYIKKDVNEYLLEVSIPRSIQVASSERLTHAHAVRELSFLFPDQTDFKRPISFKQPQNLLGAGLLSAVNEVKPI